MSVVGSVLLIFLQTTQVDQLIDRLASNSPDVRATASQAIVELGEKAIPALRTHFNHRDPEVRSRVRTLLLRLEWEPTFNPSTLAHLEWLPQVLKDGRLEFPLGKRPPPRLTA